MGAPTSPSHGGVSNVPPSVFLSRLYSALFGIFADVRHPDDS